MSVFYLPVYEFRHVRAVLFPLRYAVNGTERCCPVIRSKHSLKTSRRKLIGDPKLFGLGLGYGDVALVGGDRLTRPHCECAVAVAVIVGVDDVYLVCCLA